MENRKQISALIQKLQSFKVHKMGQIVCGKVVPFCKYGHILYNNSILTATMCVQSIKG